METAQNIIDGIGREQVKKRFGVQDRVIRHNVEKGTLPASWFAALCEMAERELPRSVFSFKGMDMEPTEVQRVSLCKMMDGEWHLGSTVAKSGNTLDVMHRARWIQSKGDSSGFMQDMWRILPKGLDVIHVGDA